MDACCSKLYNALLWIVWCKRISTIFHFQAFFFFAQLSFIYGSPLPQGFSHSSDVHHVSVTFGNSQVSYCWQPHMSEGQNTYLHVFIEFLTWTLAMQAPTHPHCQPVKIVQLHHDATVWTSLLTFILKLTIHQQCTTKQRVMILVCKSNHKFDYSYPTMAILTIQRGTHIMDSQRKRILFIRQLDKVWFGFVHFLQVSQLPVELARASVQPSYALQAVHPIQVQL